MDCKMRVAIIEPHYDDCWLNMGGLLLQKPQHTYKVVTVSKDDAWGNNINNTHHLSRYLPRFESVDLRYDSLDVDIKKVTAQMLDEQVESFEELFALMNGMASSVEALENTRRAVAGFDAVFLPLGVSHPMHILMRRWRFDQPTFRYQEYPYACYPEEQGTIASLTAGQQRFSFDIAQVIAEKERIFKELYPAEAFILDLPECPTALSAIDEELFYSRSERRADVWSRLA
jgi:hypothetical protein